MVLDEQQIKDIILANQKTKQWVEDAREYRDTLFALIEGEDSDSYISIAFADDEFDTEEYIILQKAIFCTEEDKELGMDKVYIEYKDQLYSNYGGILKVILKNGLIEIYVDCNTAKVLGTNEQITVTFDQDVSCINDLKMYLQKMFVDELGVFICEI